VRVTPVLLNNKNAQDVTSKKISFDRNVKGSFFNKLCRPEIAIPKKPSLWKNTQIM
jgi:hypothetical protein